MGRMRYAYLLATLALLIVGRPFLPDFGRLESDQRRATAELASLREELRGREEQAKAAEAEVARLRRELAQRRDIVERIQELVGAIPEYKRKVADLTSALDQQQKTVEERDTQRLATKK